MINIRITQIVLSCVKHTSKHTSQSKMFVGTSYHNEGEVTSRSLTQRIETYFIHGFSFKQREILNDKCTDYN